MIFDGETMETLNDNLRTSLRRKSSRILLRFFDILLEIVAVQNQFGKISIPDNPKIYWETEILERREKSEAAAAEEEIKKKEIIKTVYGNPGRF